MKSHSLALAVVLALHATSSIAADDGTPLEELIVSARRILTSGLGGESLDPSEVARQRARTSDTAGLLRGIPGVALYDAGGVSRLPVIRGLADDRLRTQVDGVDVAAACPNHMNSPLSYIDPTAVAAIDVYPGVAPVSVGGDSIGGSIVVRSPDAEFAGAGDHLLKGEAGTFYRSNGSGWGGNVAAAFATEHLSLGYTGAYTESDNYQAGDDFKTYTFTGRVGHSLPKDEVGSSAFQSTNHTLRAAWQFGRHLLDLSYSLQDIPDEGYANQRMDMTDNHNDRFNLGYTGRLGWATVQARAYYQHTEHAMDFGADKRYWYGMASGGMGIDGAPCAPISAMCAAGMPMKTDGKNTGLAVMAAIPLASRGLLRVGAEYQAFALDDWWPPSGSGMWPYEFINVNDGQRDRHAAFGEWEVRGERWSNILGLRFESVSTDADPVHGYNTAAFPTSGTGGSGNQTRDAALFNAQSRDRSDANWDASWILRFTPGAGQDYEFGLAQKTRSPNLYERYTWSSWQMAAFMNNTVGDGNGYFGDVKLAPEVARTVSLTADWHDEARERWGVRVTPWYTTVKDYIDAIQWDATANVPRAVPVVDDFTVLRYANQSARLYGVDLAADVRLADSERLGRLAASVAGSYTDGRNEDTGDNLYKIMPLNATVGLAHEWHGWRNSLEGEFVAAKDEVSAVRNEMPTSGYGLVHLRSRYERERWSAELGVENLFDRDYAPPLGGAYVGQGTTMMNPMPPNEPRWGTPVPGPGRSVYAAVNVKF